jgi:hypothetical protein
MFYSGLQLFPLIFQPSNTPNVFIFNSLQLPIILNLIVST